MTTPANSPSRSTDLDRTAAFDVLSNRRHRSLLRILLGRAEPTTLDELARRIARMEDGSTGDRSDRVRVDLHHRHLPKLADAGLVRYDQATGEVRCEPLADRLVPYLELDSISALDAR